MLEFRGENARMARRCWHSRSLKNNVDAWMPVFLDELVVIVICGNDFFHSSRFLKPKNRSGRKVVAASNESGLREPPSQSADGSRDPPHRTVQPKVSALAWRGSAKDTLAMEARGNAESSEKTSKRQMLGTPGFWWFFRLYTVLLAKFWTSNSYLYSIICSWISYLYEWMAQNLYDHEWINDCNDCNGRLEFCIPSLPISALALTVNMVLWPGRSNGKISKFKAGWWNGNSPGTPAKFNIEPENDGFRKESPFPGADFQVNYVKLQGCKIGGIRLGIHDTIQHPKGRWNEPQVQRSSLYLQGQSTPVPWLRMN